MTARGREIPAYLLKDHEGAARNDGGYVCRAVKKEALQSLAELLIAGLQLVNELPQILHYCLTNGIVLVCPPLNMPLMMYMPFASWAVSRFIVVEPAGTSTVFR